jgi:hypothetical protein
MTTRRAMKGVLHNFLETYTSRYLDYRGYWLLGQLPSHQNEWTIDLLGVCPDQDTAENSARFFAIRRFGEQLKKCGFAPNSVREATLRMTRDPQVIKALQAGHVAEGHMILFCIRVVMENGHVREDNRKIFVAPHDPEVESRRREADWGA